MGAQVCSPEASLDHATPSDSFGWETQTGDDLIATTEIEPLSPAMIITGDFFPATSRLQAKDPNVILGSSGNFPIVGAVRALSGRWSLRLEDASNVYLGILRAGGQTQCVMGDSPDTWCFWAGDRRRFARGKRVRDRDEARMEGPEALSPPARVDLTLDHARQTLTATVSSSPTGSYGFVVAEDLPQNTLMKLAVGTGHAKCRVVLLGFTEGDDGYSAVREDGPALRNDTANPASHGNDVRCWNPARPNQKHGISPTA